MSRRLTLALLLVAVAAASHAGCVTERQTRPLVGDPTDGAPLPPEFAGGLDFTPEPLGVVPNTGALLPIVSPDGRQVAYLVRRAGSATPIDAFAGDGLDDVTLRVAPLDDLESTRNVVTGGASWAAFTDDSSALIALRTANARCELIVHHGRDRHRAELPWAHAVTPAPSPRGDRVALAAVDDGPDSARVYVVETMSGAVLAEAPRGGRRAQWQIAPQWIDDETLVYVESIGERAMLQRWRITGGDVETLAMLELDPVTPADAAQALATVAQPLSPDRTRIAYYGGAARDRLMVYRLDDDSGRPRPLPHQSRTGAWLDANVLAVAGGQGLALTTHDGSNTRPLLIDRHLPRWADTDPTRIVLLLPGADPTQFRLLRLHVEPRPAAPEMP